MRLLLLIVLLAPGLLAVPAGAQTPDDPGFPVQWGLHNTAQTVGGKPGGTADADIDAPEAWSVTRGSDEVVVAVVDTGIAYDNPDLAERLWTNAGELGTDASGADRRANGVDDDGNGHVDDWRGWDVVGASVLDPGDADNDPRDLSGHGTHVAGILGATGGNGMGVTGVNWRVRIMNVRVRGERSNERPEDVAAGLRYAAANGARIVNASLAETAASQPIEDAVRAHPGVLFVVAAGNRDEDLDRPGNVSYPCQVDAPNLLCVAATGRADELAGFSNHGEEDVDLAAPGTITYSSQPAYREVHRDTFESDPFAAPARWLRGAAAGDVNGWGSTTTRRSSGTRSLAAHAAGEVRPDSDTWIETAQPLDLHGRQGCDVEVMTWLAAGPGSGLYVQARADRGFQLASRTPSQDTATPVGDTVAFWTGEVDGARKRVNVSDLDGRAAAYLRLGVLAGAGTPAPRAWIDDVRLRCLGGAYSADASEELGYEQGTSMATPHVAGVAALVAARFPHETAAEIKADLLRSVDVLPGLAGRVASGGRVNAYKAVARSDAAVAAGTLAVRAGAGEANRLRVARAVEGDGVARYQVSDPWTPYGAGPMGGSRVVPGAGCAEVGDAAACRATGVRAVRVESGDLDDGLDLVDGVREEADCGAGADAARVDHLDLVTGCEVVEVVHAMPVDTSADHVPQVPSPGAGRSARGLRVRVGGRRLRLRRAGVVRVRVGPVGEAVRGVVTIRTAHRLRVPGGERRRAVRLGGANFRLRAGDVATVTVPVKKAGRRLVRRLARVRVRIRVTVRDAAGRQAARTVGGVVLARKA